MSDQRQSYYARATSWALDEQAGLRSALRHSRLFALAAIVIAVLEAFALMLLTPLKNVRPIPILVDRQTGYVEMLREDGRREIRANDALIRSMLAQYVIARESFDINEEAANYRKVALWSGGVARSDYLAEMPASNPQSPLRAYPRSTLIDTRVRSVSPLGQNEALVRFVTIRHEPDNGATVMANWAAVLSYRYVDTPMSVEDRLTNPLGFQIVRYHRDAEGPPPSVTDDIPAKAAPLITNIPQGATSTLTPLAPVASPSPGNRGGQAVVPPPLSAAPPRSSLPASAGRGPIGVSLPPPQVRP